jgi:Ca2+-binding RTX toxin-like protein/Leucine-rich repeat (LRR) protein
LIDDNGDGRHYFNELGTDDVKMQLTGQVHATLPVFFPTSSQPLGNLTFSITKLSDIPGTIAITAPNISAQFGLVDLLNNLGAIPDGLDMVLGDLQDAMDSQVFGSNLPLIGNHLKDGARFIEKIRTGAIEPLRDNLQDSPPIDVLKNALFDNLGPNGLGVLGDIDGNGAIDKSDVQVVVDPSGNQVQFNLLLHQQASLLNTPLNFDIGLPSLGLSVDGGVAVKVGYDFHFSFGVSRDDGFYFGTNAKAPGTQNPIPELTVQLDAGIPDLQATGRLGFLQLSVQDNATNPTHLLGKFDVDLKDPDNDGKLTFDELAAGPSTSQIVNAKLNAQANVNLSLMATFGGSSVFPSVSADFALAWAFTNADTAAATGSFGDKPSIKFKNIRLNAGEFFSNFARPILGKVQEVLKPIQPVIDILTAPLPVLSDLPPALAVLDTDGNGSVSLAELAPLFSTDYDLSFISSVAKTIKLINSIPTTSPNLFIDLGQFDIGSDVRTDTQLTDSDLTNILEQNPESELSGQAKSFFDSLSDLNSVKGGGIAFPILQHPLDVFKLLLGQDINLFTYQMAPLMISYPMSEYFPIIGPLGVRLTGTVGATANFAFGYDTSGLREYFNGPASQRDISQLLDGFYVSDRKNADGTGTDKPEITLSAGIYASGELNLAAATAGVGGGIFATIDFNLNDPNNDGKVRIQEIIDNFNRGPLCVFDLGGALFAGLNAYVTVLTFTQTFNIATIKLLDFNFSCPAVAADPDPILATDLGGGVLRLNMGPNAGARQYGDTKDEDESFKVTPGSTANSVTVQAYGFTQEYTNVSKIVADGGAGNDTIDVESGVLAVVSLSGGIGDDTLLASTGPATLDGDAGNDQLRGGTGNDMLLGGDGDDTLLGGAGNDMLVAGTGVNLEILEGGDGDDTLVGSQTVDALSGGAGDDSLVGGDGKDNLSGGTGNDTLLGGNDDDAIQGGDGNDSIDGGAGNDSLQGNTGDDTILGGTGNDTIAGANGNDQLFGQDGIDSITGGNGNDIISGGNDDDHIDAGAGNDSVTGDAGDDRLDAGADNDTVDGGDGSDTITAGLGSDTIYGGLGSDLIFAGLDATGGGASSDSNLIYGDSPNSILGDTDQVFGDIGSDTIFGGAADDTIQALDGNDSVFGDAGNDSIVGGDGGDTISGGSGDDELFGQAGDDALAGDDGQDLVSGDQGSDLLWGGAAMFDRAMFMAAGFAVGGVTPNIVAGLSLDGAASDGKDSIFGGIGTDWLFGGGDSDLLLAGDGNDYADGGAGNDQVNGQGGDDVVRGGGNDDTLHGGPDIDKLFGDDGNDQLFGDAGEDNGNQVGQQLWGGAGNDALYAFAPSTDPLAEQNLVGDELHGGPDNDSLFGNLRQEKLFGDAGNDFIQGDGLAGSDYAPNPQAAITGAADQIFGGLGEDQLFGGGGNDVIFGGADSDRLEGQNGTDSLYGGSAIDAIVLDVDPAYAAATDVIDGHFGNAAAGDTPDDNATDILLINGSLADDSILLSQNANGQLRVDYNGRAIFANWRDPAGKPLVEQFQVSGLLGNDRIEFLSGPNTLDVSALSARGTDWIGVLNGGPGNDTLVGSAGRDRLDGGRGSDSLLGLGGDDRLFGDSGAGQGDPTDLDQLFGGQGNDDLLGGQGMNQLYAWSHDPTLGGQFGVFVDPATGALHDNDGGGQFVLEDTGLNRVIGGPNADSLFGGTRLDFLYGNGGTDQLFNRDGTPFTNLDSGLAGDEWKTYAQQTNKVWYVGGSNADDIITIDFVTEPGFLQGHHLVTRLTNNNGNFTFAAQVQLDFEARDNAGKAIWDPGDLVFDPATNQYTNPANFAGLLPPEGDFEAIIIDALAGNDQITVGPTVQKSVWIDGGSGDDQVNIKSGNPILPDQTEGAARNDTQQTAHDLIADPNVGPIAGSTLLTGLTIDNPHDEDWYKIRFATAPQSGDSLTISGLAAIDGLSVELRSAVSLLRTSVNGRLDLTGLAAGTTFFLHITSNLVPTIYQWSFALAASPNQITKSLAAPGTLLRRDVILGGSGNDILSGGSGEDWIFGGDGNDILTGGLDRQASDILFGQAGDDTFQIIPDALPLIPGDTRTTVPTLTDQFDGGGGDDRVLFLGGDLDRNGKPVPDQVAIRYNTLLHRYEFTSLIWDIANQQFMTDASAAPLQDFSFYQATNIEHTVLDTRAGDDEVHADSGYVLGGSTWGIDPGDKQRGASIAALDIRGGDGNDRVFGGAEADTIDGGPGVDFIMGGGGDDSISGGAGDDVLAGNTVIAPDRYESVTRNGVAGRNDDPSFAALLGDVAPGQVVDNLSLHFGDAGDWYIIKTPDAFKRFTNTQAAYLTPDKIDVRFGNTSTSNLFLFPAAQSDPNDPLSILPVERFAGVPDYYMLHVVNTNSSIGGLPAAMGNYQIRFSTDLGHTIDVSTSEETFKINSSLPADTPAAISLGDINGDGRADFIAAVQDYVGSLNDLQNPGNIAGYPGNPNDLLNPSFARIYFGSASTSDYTFGSNDVTLKLPAPILSQSFFGSRSIISSPGDFNGDGIDDIAVAVTTDFRRSNIDAPFASEGVYIIFGKAAGFSGVIDVVRDADVVIKGFNQNPSSFNLGDSLSIASAGDVNGDGIDDLIIGDDTAGANSQGAAYLFLGRQNWSSVLQTQLLNADFEAAGSGNPDGFIIDNTNSAVGGVPGLWHLTATGLTTDPGHSTAASFYFGTGETQMKPGNYNVGQTAGRVTSAPIDLHSIAAASLSFNYFLSTERLPFNLNTPGTYDNARVLISKDGGTFQPLSVLDNGALRDAGAANRFFGTGIALPDLLHDPTTGWTSATFDLGAYVGSTIQIRFDFASDNADNNFEGWYVDDVKVSAARLSITNASATFTGSVAGERLGSSVAGIGDFNGDTKGDFAILSRNDGKQGQAYLVNGRPTFTSGTAATTATATLTRTTDFANFQASPAGDIDGDHFDELLISSNAESFLVFGRSSLSGTKTLAGLPATLDVVATAPFGSLGDINGDGFDDLGAFALQTSPNLAETGTVAHRAGQVFLGRTDAKSALNLTTPDLVFEPARPNYDSSAFRPYQFESPGDINNDGKADLVLADAFGGDLHVYFGRALTAAQSQNSGGTGGATLPAEPYAFQLATPSPTAAPALPSGLDLTNDPSPQIRDAFALTGSAANDHLGSSQSVGDVNGDGIDDLLVNADSFSYVLFGPVNIIGLQSAASRAEMVIDRSALGVPAGRMADISGDGINDLVFIRSVATGTPGVFDVTISVFFGGATLQHNPTIASADRRITFVGGVSFDTFSPNQRLSAVALNFNGDKNADLLIIAAGLTGGPQAYMVSGKTLMNAPAGTLAIPSNASGALFTIFGDQTSREQVQFDYFGPRFGGYDPSKTPNITAIVPGDINGDGLEDIVFTDPGFSTPFHGHTIGRAYVFLGRLDSQLPPPPIPGAPPQYSLDQSNTIYQDPFFAAAASALGDISGDGYADFAISSSREDGVFSTASAFLFFGGSPFTAGVFRASQFGLSIHRTTTGSLNGVSLNGPLSITAGDFDGDGMPELAIGEPQRIVEDSQDAILNTDSRGSVYIFRTITYPLFLASADVTLHGDGAFDKLGTLPTTGPVDLNGDRINDLLIGAAQADLLAGSVISDAGKIYTIYGSPKPQTLPTGNAVLPLTNETITGAGDFLVDPATGQPVNFHDPDASSSNYTIPANQTERWYQFSTLGDGLPGNQIRLTPGAENVRNIVVTGQDATLTPTAGSYAVSTAGTTLLVGGQPAKIGIMELDLSQFLDEAFQPADIETAILTLGYLNASISPGQTFRVSILNGEGDGIVSPADATAAATLVDQETLTPFQLPSGVFSIDLTDAVRAALQAGKTRLTLRLETSSPQASIEITRFGFGGGPFPALNINTLQHPGVLADLYDASGILLAKSQSIIDLRGFGAGTFFLRVFNPFAPANQAMPFTIAISPPIAGSAHAQSDRDQIHGGDGNDTIAGNGNLDELFGDAGTDYFVADSVELHDQQPGEVAPTLPPASEASNIPLAVADPQITIADPGLRGAIADALSIGHTQLPAVQLSRPIFASDLAHITRLNAAGLDIVDLTGLELLKNLSFLDLSNNSIATLVTTDVNQIKHGLAGLGFLQVLDLDSNQLDDADLPDIAKLTSLKSLSIDYNDLRNISPLSALTGLQFLSLDARPNLLSILPGQALGTDVLKKLQNPTLAAGDQFGQSIASLGQNILVGDPLDDTAAANAGAVYLIDGITGALLRTFLPPLPAAGTQFGFSIAVLGNNVLIGAPLAKVGNTNSAGAAYLFDSQSGALLQTFVSPTPSSGDEFGWSVAALGNNALIGAPLDEVAAGSNTGVAYLFDPATGQAIHTYLSPTPTTGDNFGLSVAAAGNNILVAAPFATAASIKNAGAVYLLDASTGSNLRTLISPHPAANEGFGNAVAASASNLFIGAPFHNNNAGAVYVYDFTGANLVRTIDNPNLAAPRTDDQFASSLAVSGNKLLVGSPFDFPGGVDHAGNAFLFDVSTGALLQTVVSPVPAQLDFLGTSVAFAGNNLLVGSPGNGGGSVYLVEGSRISDLGSLTALTNLNWLSVSGNRISDVSPLASINNLHYLDLHANRITDIAPLGSLTNLQRLLLNRNPLDNPAQSVIANLLANFILDFSYDLDQAPVVQPIAPQATVVGTPVNLNFAATDPDAGDALFFTATSDNPSVSVAIQGNQLTLTPPPAGSLFTGTVHITLTAFDGPSGPDDFRGRSSQQTFDLSVGVAAIYGTKFNDLNGNGTRDAGEPGLAGWRIFLDTNQNGSLDAGEVSTTTDANGNYSFNNLAAGSYSVAEVTQPGWFQTSPRNLLAADFTSGVNGFVASGATNQWHTSTRRSGDAGHSAPNSFYFGSDATGTYSNNAAGTLTSPAVDLSNASGKILLNFNQFLSAIDGVNQLSTADFGPAGQPNANGYTRTGLFHLSTGRGSQVNHSATNSMYFGTGESAAGGGTYTANSTGTLTSPLINLAGITGPIQLSFNQLLAFPTIPLFPATGDAATVTIISGANRTVIADNFGTKRNLTNTVGFQSKTFDLSAFAGQQIQVEFKFQADSDIRLAEGWYVDDIVVSAPSVDVASVSIIANGNTTRIADNATLGNLLDSTGGFVASSFDISTFAGKQIQVQFAFQADSALTAEGWYIDDVSISVGDSRAIPLTIGHASTANNLANFQILNLGPDRSVNEGSLVQLASNAADPNPTGSNFAYAWSVVANNGQVIPAGNSPNFSFTAADNGTYTVNLAVTGSTGVSAAEQLVVTAGNVAPLTDLGPDATIQEGAQFTRAGSFTDPGADTWSATVDYGDGTGPQPLTLNANKTFTLSKLYSLPGIYTVAVTVKDKDQAVGIDSMVVTVLPGTRQGTPNADAYVLRLDPTGTLTQFFLNVPTTGSPTFALPLAVLGPLTFNMLAGDDTLTIDFANGNPIPAGGLTLDAGAGNDLLKIIGTAGPDNISITASQITFGSAHITYSAIEQETIDTGDGDDTLTIAASIPFSPLFNAGIGNNILNVDAGTYNFSTDAAGLNVHAHNAAVVNFAASQHLNSLTLNNTSRAILTPGGAKFIRTNALTIAPNAALDLSDNDLILQSNPADKAGTLATLTNLIKAARGSGAWTAPGLTSSFAASEAQHRTGLAILLNDRGNSTPLYFTFDGQAVDVNSVLVKYTYNGDTDLNGKIDADDYFAVDRGFANKSSGYRNGDFDFNGVVDADDYFLIDRAFAGQTGVLSESRPLLSATVSSSPTQLNMVRSQKRAHHSRHHRR